MKIATDGKPKLYASLVDASGRECLDTWGHREREEVIDGSVTFYYSNTGSGVVVGVGSTTLVDALLLSRNSIIGYEAGTIARIPISRRVYASGDTLTIKHIDKIIDADYGDIWRIA